MTTVPTPPVNALTIDVEDYFHVTAFSRVIPQSAWETYPLRVEENTHRVLAMLDDHGVKATFFVLGWVAEKCGRLVREIHRRGHEVACHGYRHELIYAIGPGKFREDLRAARMLLEDLCGARIEGYRAPSFSITAQSEWALDILIEEGFRYDSSLFPIYHDTYGMRGIDPLPHEIRRESGVIKEFPLSTVSWKILGKRVTVPVAGGGYLRLLPLGFMARAMRRINDRQGAPVVLYFHPWEIDPGQPRIKAGFKSRFRHYHNLDKTEGKIRGLLGTFPFAPMGQVLGLQVSATVGGIAPCAASRAS